VVADEFVIAELDGAQQVLERLAFATTAQKVTQWGEIGLGDDFGKAQVEVQAAAAEDVGEEVLHIEPWLLDALFVEVGGAGGEDFEERFGSWIQGYG
jgi:hypothetical protein